MSDEIYGTDWLDDDSEDILEENLFDLLASDSDERKKKRSIKEDRRELKSLISTKLATKAGARDFFGTKDPEEVNLVRNWINEIIQESGTRLPKKIQVSLLEEMVLEITSYGKIHDLIKDSSISEVMINASGEVWIERKGKLLLSEVKFESDDEVMDLATKIASNVGRSINKTNPIVDARLPDGSRVNIVIPPIALKGVTITIRKFFEEKLTIDNLISFGTITPEAANFLRDLVISGANIIVSGGTGSGKTTTLNIVSNFVPNDERIVTIEDSAELQLSNDHVVKLESREANAEGKGAVSIRKLVVTALRMRPDRIIVGEVRDGTAYDLLQAMNTGHDGSMATVHANDPDACMTRLENLVLMAGVELPARAIKQNIAFAVDAVVQISRLPDGSRKITHISEVIGFDESTDKIITKPFFEFEQTGIDENEKIIGEQVFAGHKGTDRLKKKFKQHRLDLEESLGIKGNHEKKELNEN